MQNPKKLPRLPRDLTPDERDARELQLSLARTAYNYVRSYPDLEDVPLCAGVPSGEDFSPEYNGLVLETAKQITENFGKVVLEILSKEIGDNFDSALKNIYKILSGENPFSDVIHDVSAIVGGLEQVVEDSLQEGPSAFLKSTLFDMLRKPGKGEVDHLHARKDEDYEALIATLPKPQMLTIEEKDWMPKGPKKPEHWFSKKQCEQDWYFGYLQVAGFNTTNLRRVSLSKEEGKQVVHWDELQEKLAVTDEIFQQVMDDAKMSLKDAIAKKKIYVCDYAMLLGDPKIPLEDKESKLHGERRYLSAPIALFYYNEDPLPDSGFPPRGALQPIAIQLSQTKKGATVFTPNNCQAAGANDECLLKWRIAKYFVNVACAIHHESIAHLGDCHLILESAIVATHRQLAKGHPIFTLLEPHMRFTIPINYAAANNLIVPGGVVATNVGANIHWTLHLVNEARNNWHMEDNRPDQVFEARGVDGDSLPLFPFRDDTLLLWEAIRDYVREYLSIYYKSDEDVQDDDEVQAWVKELGEKANLQGVPALTSIDNLRNLVAHLIYIAGPQHASVNYGQYPLLSYVPCVAGTIYKEPPTAKDELTKETDCLPWFPPLDVGLYTISFVYLLSSIQYDVLGRYSKNPQYPYFDDPAAEQALRGFQKALARAESIILETNPNRPMPYYFQLPSRVPNSISI